jgi:PAS domain S-box-containing protein
MRRAESGQPAFARAARAKRVFASGPRKEGTAGSSVAPNLSERTMARSCIGSGLTSILKNANKPSSTWAEGQRLAHTGGWTFNATGFEHWSPELFAIHGLDPRNTPPSSREYLALVHPDDREFVAQEIHRMLADHRGFDFTKRVARRDGSIRHVRCVGTPATGGGMFQGFVGTAIDVTEHEELTKALWSARNSSTRRSSPRCGRPSMRVTPVASPRATRLRASERNSPFRRRRVSPWPRFVSHAMPRPTY